MDQKLWFKEIANRETIVQGLKIKKKLFEKKTPWQLIEVYDTEAVGKLLTLDGKTMVSDLDEFVYHELMAHISMMVKRNAQRVLIIGGGDLGIVRELIKYPEIQTIDLVEIDEEVIRVSDIYFPELTRKALQDKRLNVFAEDGIQFIQKVKDPYDIILVDSTDPEGFAAGLVTLDFYQAIDRGLKKDGLMLAQAGNPFYDEFHLQGTFKNLQKVFPVTEALCAPMPIYPGVYWTFIYGSKKYSASDLDESKIDFMQNLQKELQWYNINWHRGALHLPNLVLKRLGLL